MAENVSLDTRDRVWAPESDPGATPFWSYTSPPEDATPAAKQCIPALGLRARLRASLHGHYQYKPLDHQKKEIRLLQLRHRTHKDGIVQCNMKSFAHQSSPGYVTLSYTWDDPDVTSSSTSDILINNKLFAVTGNLYQFLCVQSLNHDFCGGTWLWIDQICIDQTNIHERNEQVARMGHIYRCAQTTIIWLGSGVEETDPYNADWAMKTIQSCSPRTVRQLCPPQNLLGLSRETAESAIMLAYEALKPYDSSWRAWPLEISWRLGRCAYWSRMWILQEVVLSRHLVVKFGVHEITWEQLEHFLDLSSAYSSNLEELNVILPERYKESFERGRAATGNIESLIHVRRRWQHQVQTQEFEETGGQFEWHELLSFCRDRGCKDQRDRVFGVLALVKSSLAIPVDYGKVAGEMWKQVIQIQMSQDHHLQAYLRAKWNCCAYLMYSFLGRDLYKALNLCHVTSGVAPDDITEFVVGELHHRGGRPTCQHIYHSSVYDEALEKIQQQTSSN